MTTTDSSEPQAPSSGSQSAGSTTLRATRWLGLVVMMCTSFVLVTAEFLPSGLLTPMADDLGITAGQAAQTITVTALVGFLAAPTIASLVPRMDRRKLLTLLAAAGAVSSAVVAVAPTLELVMLARIMLGVALSGFWAMSLAVAVALTRTEQLGRGVMIVTAGTSIATVAGVPAAVLLANLAGWRTAFLVIAAVTAAVAVLLAVALPPIPAGPPISPRDMFDTLRGPVRLGLTGHVLTVLGHFTAYAFIRVALEQVDGVTVGTLTVLLALFGLGGFAGNLLVGMLVDRHLVALAYAVPAVTGVAIAVVALGTSSIGVIAIAVLIWGAAFGGWLIVVNAWTSRRLPDRLEAGGGLVVAGFQLAIMVGAAGGGLILDLFGVRATLLVGAVLLAGATLIFGAAARQLERTPAPLDGVTPAEATPSNVTRSNVTRSDVSPQPDRAATPQVCCPHAG